MSQFSRRALALLPAGALALTLLAGCGGGSEASTAGGAAEASDAGVAAPASPAPTANPVSDTPVEISMLYLDEGSYPYREDWLIWSEITKRTNVTLAPVVVPASDWETKVQLLLSTGDAPDFASRINARPEYVSGGTLVAISDYADRLPNYMSKFSEWGMAEEVATMATYPDGKWYEMRALYEVPWIEYTFSVRKDIVEANNLAIPKDYLELKTFLQAIKDATGADTVWTDKWGGRFNNFWGPSWGCNIGTDYEGMRDWTYYLAESDEWVYNGATEEYRAYLTYMADLVRSGLYDPETFTLTGDQIVAKITTNESFFSASNYNEVVEWNEFGPPNVGPEYEFMSIVPPSGPKGDIGVRIAQGNYQVIIPKTTEQKPHFDTVLRFLDWCYGTEEASELFYWGVEGETFQRVNGVREPVDGISYLWMNPGQEKDMRKDFGMDNMSFKHYTSEATFYERMSPAEKEWAAAYTDRITFPALFPSVFFDTTTQEEYTTMGSSLNEYAQQMYVKFITCEEDIATGWDAYVAELENRGMDEYVRIKNDTYHAQTAQ